MLNENQFKELLAKFTTLNYALDLLPKDERIERSELFDIADCVMRLFLASEKYGVVMQLNLLEPSCIDEGNIRGRIVYDWLMFLLGTDCEQLKMIKETNDGIHNQGRSHNKNQ